MAMLEIPELQSQLQQDDAAIKNASDQITHAQNELSRARGAAQCSASALRPVEQASPNPNRAWWRSRKWTMRKARIWPPRRRWTPPKSNLESAAKPAGRGASQERARSGAVRLREDHGALCGRDHPAFRQPGHA